MNGKWWCRLALGAALVLAGGAADGKTSAPPLRAQQELARLRRRLTAELSAGRFGQGEKVAKQIEALWKRCQGEKHWQTIDARYRAQRWGRLAKLSAEDGRAVVRA